MYSAYALTLTDYVVVGAAILIAMFLLHKVLRLFGVNREAATGYALILPWMLGFLIWNLGPFIASLYLSFTEYTILAPPTWIGFNNYVEMFTDDRNFWRVLRFTLGYSVINVPLGLLGALITATLLNQNVRGLGLWRTLASWAAIRWLFLAGVPAERLARLYRHAR